MTSIYNGKIREYKTWCDMKQRCKNTNHVNYHRYGGRGIAISNDWEIFDNLYRDMGQKPLGYQIDRTDNNKGYCKENCKWVTQKQNTRNRNPKEKSLPLGVRRIKNGTYTTSIKIEGFNCHIGTFKSEEDAASKFIKIYKEWYGKLPSARSN